MPSAAAALLPLPLPQHHRLCSNRNTLLLSHFRKPSTICMNSMSSTTPTPITASLDSGNKGLLSSVSPLEAILFDIDGTLCDSDPIHYYAFREMLQEVGFNGGVPITLEYFEKNISGMHNENLCPVLFPDWEVERARKFLEDKEVMFRRIAEEKLEAMKGLEKLRKWIEDHGLKRAAVTNAPRPNAEMMLKKLGLTDFFETLVIGCECERAKPFPDPYLKALDILGVSHKHAFVFEDSFSGTKAGVAAGMPVVGVIVRNPESLLAGAGVTFVINDFNDPKLWAALEELEVVEGVKSSSL